MQRYADTIYNYNIFLRIIDTQLVIISYTHIHIISIYL